MMFVADALFWRDESCALTAPPARLNSIINAIILATPSIQTGKPYSPNGEHRSVCDLLSLFGIAGMGSKAYARKRRAVITSLPSLLLTSASVTRLSKRDNTVIDQNSFTP